MVLVHEDQILTAIYFNDEPAYENIQGNGWQITTLWIIE
jgi:hypothetical protein